MTIIATRFDRRVPGSPGPSAGTGVTRRLTSRRSDRHRGEPWRDWAAIALLNHAQLLVVALIRPSWPWLLLLAIPFAVTLSTGTLTVLHDAGHRRFARTEWPNVFAVQTSVPLGLWVSHWTLKHRVHHRASQVFPVDEATRSNLVRMHPGVPLKPHHRFQHIYAFPLYGLAWVGELNSQLTFVWKGNVIGVEVPSRAARARSFLLEKAFCAVVLLPYVLLLGPVKLAIYVVTAMTLGAVLAAIVLVVGHINEGLYPPSQVPSQKEWSKHIVRTTANFNTSNRVVRWLTGGMTHHLAHHLKPVAPRHELPTLNDTVVQDVVAKSGLPLVEYPSLFAATLSHARRLRELGRPDVPGSPEVLLNLERAAAAEAAAAAADRPVVVVPPVAVAKSGAVT
jgi:linoleoyl-CoA desaturase